MNETTNEPFANVTDFPVQDLPKARTIWKSALPMPVVEDDGSAPMLSHVTMPKGADVVKCEVQHGVPTIWYSCQPTAPNVSRGFLVTATGQEVPLNAVHLESVYCPFRRICLHFWEVVSVN